MIHNKKLEHALQKVQKPGRYVGGELNSVVKDPSQVEVRFASASPIPTKSACPTWALKSSTAP